MNTQNARFPVSRIMDGTLKKLSRCDLQVYMVIAAFKNYNTNESWVGYKTIRKYVSETNGRRIGASIAKLEKLKLVESWKEARPNMEGETGRGYERRKYKVLGG